MPYYFGSKPVFDWNPNDTFESGHDFINQISEQKGNIASQQGRYDTQSGNVENARNAYQDAYKGMSSYSDLYNQAKGSEGVDDAKAQYQKSLNTVNATNSAMNNLPSSINAGSNVVLNASQRNAALGNQMMKFQNTLDYQTRQNAGDRDMYQTALASAQDLAGKNMTQEQYRTDKALQDKQLEMDQLNNMYNQLIQERQIMRQIYGDMYEDEYRHRQQEIEAWAANLQAETERYKADASKYAADAGLRLQQYLAKKQAEQKDLSFLGYLNSDSYMADAQKAWGNEWGTDTGWGEKDAILNSMKLSQNYSNAVKNSNWRDLEQIMNGSVYQDYLNWKKGQ